MTIADGRRRDQEAFRKGGGGGRGPIMLHRILSFSVISLSVEYTN